MIEAEYNRGEEEADRLMDRHVPWLFWFFVGFGLGINIGTEMYGALKTNDMNSEIEEFRKNYRSQVYGRS